jgi:hypothetical protein
MLIPLGCHCNITFLQQELRIKRETGLFEWLQSDKLSYITDIINSIKDGIDTDIIKGVNKNLYIINKKIFTFHYNLEEYKKIFTRRAKRFLEQIKNETEILFVRINAFTTPLGERLFTSEEEINNFGEAIHSINSNLKIKFLMIHTVNESSDHKILDETKIHNMIFFQKEFQKKDCPHYFLKNNKKIRDLFAEYLIETGYDITETIYKRFSDKD